MSISLEESQGDKDNSGQPRLQFQVNRFWTGKWGQSPGQFHSREISFTGILVPWRTLALISSKFLDKGQRNHWRRPLEIFLSFRDRSRLDKNYQDSREVCSRMRISGQPEPSSYSCPPVHHADVSHFQNTYLGCRGFPSILARWTGWARFEGRRGLLSRGNHPRYSRFSAWLFKWHGAELLNPRSKLHCAASEKWTVHADAYPASD